MKSKYIDERLCTNRYLSEEEFNSIIEKTEEFYERILSLEYTPLSFYEKISILGFCGEMLSILKEKEQCIDKIYAILVELKQYIEEHHYADISLFGGLTNIAIFLIPVIEETKYFEKFQNTLNDIIIEVASRQSLLYKNNLKITCSSHYDAINGLSGVAIYLLTLRSENAEKCLRDILSYFVELSLLKTVNGILVPGWYVSKDCLPTDEYKRDFQKGCINFSLSHGIAGPLYILGKSMSVGIEVDGQRKAIERILGEYNKVFTYVDGVCIWPGMMKLEDYLSKKDITNNLRMSWCYGSLGVLRSIIVAADAIGNKPLVKWGEIQLLKIIEMPIKQFYLDSPIICHGYAGVCGMLRKTYEGNKQRDCLSKSKEVLKILLNMYEPTFPYGYKDYMRKYTDKGFVEEYTDKLTFLEGATGIYLELLTFLKEKNHFEKSLFLES